MQAAEVFDAASRYLLFPLKRAVADALLPRLETAPPAELCYWLMLSDMYVFKCFVLLLLKLFFILHFHFILFLFLVCSFFHWLGNGC